MWSICSFFCQTAWHWANIHWDSYKVRELILMVSSSTNVIAFLLLAQDWTTSFFHYPIASLIHKMILFTKLLLLGRWWTDDGCMYSVPSLISVVWIVESVNSPMLTYILWYVCAIELILFLFFWQPNGGESFPTWFSYFIHLTHESDCTAEMRVGGLKICYRLLHGGKHVTPGLDYSSVRPRQAPCPEARIFVAVAQESL